MNKKKKEHLIYGRNPVLDALAGSTQLERVFIRDTLHGEFEKTIRHHCKLRDVPLKRVPAIKLDKLTHQKNHQGIVGVISLIQYSQIEDLVPFIFEKGQAPFFLILDNVQDVRNIGAIARSAEAFGVHGLVISGKNAGVLNADAIKTSAGSLLRIPVCRYQSTEDLIRVLQNSGIRVVGTTMNAEVSIREGHLTAPVALVLGSEGSGLSAVTEEACDVLLKIPQKGITESLNVSVAAGIILYESAAQTSAESK